MFTKEQLNDIIIGEIKQIFDPEIPVDIYSLGLIYDVDIQDDFHVIITMTLTAPNCPAAVILPGQVENRIKNLPDVNGVQVDVTFDPPWTIDRLSEDARLILNID
jgi:FeS assembly SUF system protein